MGGRVCGPEFRRGAFGSCLVRKMRLLLGNQLNATRWHDLADDPQELNFHDAGIVGLVDCGGEPVHEILELGVGEAMPIEAAPDPLAKDPTHSRCHGEARRLNGDCVRSKIERGLMTRSLLAWGIRHTLGWARGCDHLIESPGALRQRGFGHRFQPFQIVIDPSRDPLHRQPDTSKAAKLSQLLVTV